MTTPLLEVRIDAEYGGRRSLRDVGFALDAGETMGLVGSSGAGKSTLVMALLGLLRFKGGRVTGEVRFAGRNLLALPERELRRVRGREIALIPQSPMTALNPAVSLRRHFVEAWRAHAPAGAAFEMRLSTLVEQMQLPREREFLLRRPGEISVGQAQRVMIALAMLHRPRLLIADEPTSALDPVTQAEILRLLAELPAVSGAALLYVSHDLLSVVQLCGSMAVLDAGALVERLRIEDLGRAQQPVTRALLSSLPVPLELLLAARAGSGKLRAGAAGEGVPMKMTESAGLDSARSARPLSMEIDIRQRHEETAAKV